MEGFTFVDGVAAAIILISSILAFSRGFVREVLSIGGWIAAAIVGYIFADELMPILATAPVLEDFLGDQCELALLASFIVIMVLGLIVMSIFTPLFANAVQRSFLGGLDQALGFLFGALRGALLVVVGFIAYEFAFADGGYSMVDDSKSAQIFADLKLKVQDQVPTDVPGWVEAKFYEFVAVCESGSPVDTTDTQN